MNHASYPDGSYSNLLVSETQFFSLLQTLGVLTGRTMIEGNLATPVTAPIDLFKLPVTSVYNLTYVNKAKAAIDEAVINGSTAILVIHDVQPGAPSPGSILSTEGLQQIVSYAQGFTTAGRLSNMTISEWYAAQP
jgi:hypothetical protein